MEKNKDYKIIDNFLLKEEFKKIQEICTYNLPFYYNRAVADINKTKSDGYYFCHFFYENNKLKSSMFKEIIDPLLKKFKFFALLKAKANLYPSTSKIKQHDWHVDFPIPHKGFLFYINTNNGFTILKDGTKIESVANRALFFNSSEKHCSTTCTDQNVRINININYV